MTRVLFVSHSDAFGAFRVGSHHLAREMARAGHDVVHVSTPISVAHRVLGRVSEERRSAVPSGPLVVDGVRHVVPRSLLPAGAGRFNLAQWLDRYPDTRGVFDIAFIDQPLMWSGVITDLARILIYRPTDEYPSGVKARLQAQILAAAHGVVATSPVVLRALGEVHQPSIVVPNGVDIDVFSRDAGVTRETRCVYVGAFDSRFDWSQVAEWTASFPAVEFLLAGPVDSVPIGLPRNVRLRGAVPYREVPALLQSSTVGLLPLSDDPLNSGRSPMKLFEYLASGLTVVSRETPVLSHDPEHGIFTYRDRDSALAALNSALESAAPNARGRVRARSEEWSIKADQILRFAEQCV